MTDSPRISTASMDLMFDELRTASGGLPDAWEKTGLVTRSQVATVRARVAKSSRIFLDARSAKPNIDFSRDRSVQAVDFIPAPMDDDFDW